MNISDKPLVFWSWNNTLDIPELLRQLRGFRQAGIGGCFLHARAGLRTPYLGREWMDACRAVCEEAQRLGLDIYLYDEDGWPSGFAAGTVPAQGEDYCQKNLFFTNTPPEADAPNQRLWAAYARHGKDFTPVWQADDDTPCPPADLYAVYTIRRSYADLTYPPAVDCFLQHTHEVYARELSAYFGRVIRGIFTDEPQLASEGFHWGRHLIPLYAAATGGRDLTADLWRLALDGEDVALTRQVRYAYRRLLQQQFGTVYFRRIDDWCRAHGLLATGHMAGEDGLLMQLPINGSVMPHYRYFGIPGIDHLGRRYAPLSLLKQVQSAAAQLGRDRCLSETFGCSGWDLSFDDIARIWGWQAINGLTTPCLHLSAYSLAGRRKRDYPPVFSEQEPWWEQAAVIMGFMTNVTRFFTAATRQTDILVLQPLHDLWRRYSPDSVADCRGTSTAMRSLLENLRYNGLDFDLGDETILAESGSVADGRLTVGQASYGLVIVPPCTFLEPETVGLLQKLAAGGGRVLYIDGRPPVPGLPAGVQSVNHAELLRKQFCYTQWDTPFHLTTAEGDPLGGVNTWYGCRPDGGRQIALYPICENLVRGQDTAELQLDGLWHIWQVDPLDNSRRLLSAAACGGCTYAAVPLSCRRLTLLLLQPAAEAYGPQPAADIGRRYQPLDWQMTRTAPNSLTLDEAALSYDGRCFGTVQPMPVLRQTVAGLSAEASHDLWLCFTFVLAEGAVLPLTLALETDSLQALSCNGRELPLPGADAPTYFDRSVRCLPLDGCVQAGENRLICRYRLEAGARRIGGDFESDYNRFCPRWEPECVYLLGDFAVCAAERALRRPTFYRVPRPSVGPVFRIAAPQALHMGDLTPQALWFYRGAVRCETVLPPLAAGQQAYLLLRGLQAVTATVQVGGGEPVPVIDDTRPVPLTGLRGDGTDRVTLTLFGSNRNLLGPHHHRSGEVRFIGTKSFDGEYDWTDEFTPNIPPGRTWEDGYAFVPFGVEAAGLLITDEDRSLPDRRMPVV